MSTPRIPQTDSITELAHFWETHDLTDFEDQLEEVREPVFQRETTVRIPLPQKDAETLKELARAKGMHDVDLARQWIIEHVHRA
jgi:hypothetical protein